jgi:tRNA threonylcarbamoyladenosine biosynthesis protein TsaE
MRLRLRSTHPDATAAVGTLLAGLLAPGDVVVLSGPLGAGKTRLVQGVAAGLGIERRVTSPTFVLVRRHEAAIPLVHVDAYRLSDARDLLTLDDDVLDATVVTCVEWGDVVRDVLPDDRIECDVQVEGDDGDAPRGISIDLVGEGWAGREVELIERCGDLVRTTDGLELLEAREDA